MQTIEAHKKSRQKLVDDIESLKNELQTIEQDRKPPETPDMEPISLIGNLSDIDAAEGFAAKWNTIGAPHIDPVDIVQKKIPSFLLHKWQKITDKTVIEMTAIWSYINGVETKFVYDDFVILSDCEGNDMTIE